MGNTYPTQEETNSYKIKRTKLSKSIIRLQNLNLQVHYFFYVLELWVCGSKFNVQIIQSAQGAGNNNQSSIVHYRLHTAYGSEASSLKVHLTNKKLKKHNNSTMNRLLSRPFRRLLWPIHLAI